ncbi:MAG TPA: aspartate--tRNA ligase [bacterium]|nr:aspartate--tRNA ligase [bacterium]HPV65287.1 aspartate--tRNA ligase [bacterium]
MLRTHTCGELSSKNLGEKVILSGWVNSYRDLGGLIFIDLRDKYGLTQIKFNSNDGDKKIADALKDVKNEWVLQINGLVVARDEANKNNKINTGEIEVEILDVVILNKSLPLPFELNDEKTGEVNEALRLKYRFLDLRREKIQKMLKTKDEIIKHIRSYFHNLNFTEIQTPILANSSPEGARDFLIPSRIYPGKFYALPQAPQQFKQLLMVGGVDKYFQIAPCFRDEDPRMDRHYGEFYQVDMEMSFVEQDDIFKTMEPLMKDLVEKFSDKKMIGLLPDGRFQQISWTDAINRFGSDKPDLRFEMELTDISDLVKNSDFAIFTNQIKNGGFVKALNVKGGAKFSRKEIDETIEEAKKKGLKGLSYIVLKDEKFQSSLVKFLGDNLISEIINKCKSEEGDLIFIAADEWRTVCLALGYLRNYLAEKMNLKDNSLASLVWVVDFPMYEYSEIEEGRIDFAHNPFSMPQGGMESLLNKEPLSILAHQFDLVFNGFEVSSGAIRNHNPEVMYKAFEIAGYSKEEVDQNFSAMINAFSYGAPPHGGNAPGLDRIVMVLNNWNSIRDIYAFPKDSKGKDLMSGSPCEVKEKQLEELNIKVNKKNQEIDKN